MLKFNLVLDKTAKVILSKFNDNIVKKIFTKNQTSIGQNENKKGDKKRGGIGKSFLGGFFGALLGTLRPIKDFLKPISIIFVSIIGPILKPFLVLFLMVGGLLYKMLKKSGGIDSVKKITSGEGEFKDFINLILLIGALAILLKPIFIKAILKFGFKLVGYVLLFALKIGAFLIGLPGIFILAIIAAIIILVALVTKYRDIIKEKIEEFFDKIKDFFGSIGFDKTAEAIENLKQIFLDIIDNIANIGESIMTIITGKKVKRDEEGNVMKDEDGKVIKEKAVRLEALKDLGKNLLDLIINAVEGSFGILKLTGSFLWDIIIKVFDFFYDLGEDVREWFNEVFRKIIDKVLEIKDWLYEKIKNGLDFLKDIGKTIWDKLIGIFENSFDVLKGIGGWIKDKIKSFISPFKKNKKSNSNIPVKGDIFFPASGGNYLSGPQGTFKLNSKDDIVAGTNLFSNKNSKSSNNITININNPTGKIDSSLIEEIKRKIMSALNLGGKY